MQAIPGLAPDSPSLTQLGGAVWPVKTPEIPLAFNPSITKGPRGELLAVIRRSNYALDTKFGALKIPSGDKSVVNATYFSYLDGDLNPVGWKRVSFSDEPRLSRGVEDARLLHRDGQWFLNVVMLEDHTPRARIARYSLDLETLHATHIITYPGKVASKPEKNWMALADSGLESFDYVSEMPNGLRGGSSLIAWGKGYIALCHRTYLKKNQYYNPMTFGIQEGIERTYTHVFVEFTSDLEIKRVSKEFFLIGRGIEFGVGLVDLEDDLALSFGVDDKESWFGRISKLKVKKLLEEGA